MAFVNNPTMENIQKRIYDKMLEAEEKYGEFASGHEAYGVMMEEMEELWNEIKKKPYKRDANTMIIESIDIAAVAIRFAYQISIGGVPQR